LEEEDEERGEGEAFMHNSQLLRRFCFCFGSKLFYLQRGEHFAHIIQKLAAHFMRLNGIEAEMRGAAAAAPLLSRGEKGCSAEGAKQDQPGQHTVTRMRYYHYYYQHYQEHHHRHHHHHHHHQQQQQQQQLLHDV
jgi:hypothetical protein